MNEIPTRSFGNVLNLSAFVLCWGLCSVLLSEPCHAQINTGSDGHDGALNPTANMVINMADHPDGIYHYTSINIPANVTITFIPNAKNTPVVWLVAGNCTIKGAVDVSGKNGSQGSFDSTAAGASGGPGGYRGGNAGQIPGDGHGPGGGTSGAYGESAAFGAIPTKWNGIDTVEYPNGSIIYGNKYLVPLIGGSGGGGSSNIPVSSSYTGNGGGGGGAILIAASGSFIIDGAIVTRGGIGGWQYNGNVRGGGGSGGAIRLVGKSLSGSGSISCSGGAGSNSETGGKGRVRLDIHDNNFGGQIDAVVSQGFQPLILPSQGQLPQVTVVSVAGIAVTPSPTGVVSTPDAVIASQHDNPTPIVVKCTGISLNTPITVTVKPANGKAITAAGYNNSGSLSSSTATVSLNLPRGGGIIYATAATTR